MNKFHLRFDIPLLIAIISLITLGSMSVWSASGYSMPILERHVARAGIAMFALLLFSLIPAKRYRQFAPHLFVITIILLLGVIAAGETVNGAKRWLALGPIRFQPSELVKVAVPMMAAWLIVRDPGRPGLHKIFLCAAVTAVPASLIVIQPDLDGAIFTVIYTLFVLFLAGMSWRIIGSVLALVAAVVPVMWFFFMEEYQKMRVTQFLNPESDPLGSGYQIIQSLIAIGSGGVRGKGFMSATQGQLGFIPESHTDFIFSTFAEEWGFIGSAVMIVLYLFISGRALWLAANTNSPFSRLVSGALAMSFFLYAFINLGMVSGLLPVMGSPLPFISYGGTAMITQGACFGIIMALCCGKQPIEATWSNRTFARSA
ncbi:rod shape-determining protein RodA [Enterovibrio paralichthyis]|uniref:rod shape-determining protein RodA n=1 Tax=Enterovibrio paralichthyis TaxID=2853805 RepID=UPI001C481006|nr:rod shape-determining protein RodA [Enterovibrio paralichthyis]MBV7297450.1 rod shape-determining protein RodA [Enterovibrio paralichthyis]